MWRMSLSPPSFYRYLRRAPHLPNVFWERWQKPLISHLPDIHVDIWSFIFPCKGWHILSPRKVSRQIVRLHPKPTFSPDGFPFLPITGRNHTPMKQSLFNLSMYWCWSSSCRRGWRITRLSPDHLLKLSAKLFQFRLAGNCKDFFDRFVWRYCDQESQPFIFCLR